MRHDPIPTTLHLMMPVAAIETPQAIDLDWSSGARNKIVIRPRLSNGVASNLKLTTLDRTAPLFKTTRKKPCAGNVASGSKIVSEFSERTMAVAPTRVEPEPLISEVPMQVDGATGKDKRKTSSKSIEEAKIAKPPKQTTLFMPRALQRSPKKSPPSSSTVDILNRVRSSQDVTSTKPARSSPLACFTGSLSPPACDPSPPSSVSTPMPSPARALPLMFTPVHTVALASQPRFQSTPPPPQMDALPLVPSPAVKRTPPKVKRQALRPNPDRPSPYAAEYAKCGCAGAKKNRPLCRRCEVMLLSDRFCELVDVQCEKWGISPEISR